MALKWNWDDKYGEVTCKRGDHEWNLNIYGGNALAIFLNEYEEDGKDMYYLANFFADLEHAKRCLGLAKNYKDTYGTNPYEGEYVKFRLNMAHPKARKLAELIAKSFKNVTLELYKEEQE